MILWFLLFAIIVAISFVLAYNSMQDFQEKAAVTTVENSLYLIRHPQGFTREVLDSLHNQTVEKNYLLSIERLFKGANSAFVIFGPKPILQNFTAQLHLLELENYTDIDDSQVTGWEMGVKDILSFHTSNLPNIFEKLPTLEKNEQFWWQIVLQPQKENLLAKILSNKDSTINLIKRWLGFPTPFKTYDLVMNKTILTDPNTKQILSQKGSQRSFQAQVRCILFMADDHKRRSLATNLENIGGNILVKVPRPITSPQMLALYKTRSLPVTSERSFLITTEEIQNLALKS